MNVDAVLIPVPALGPALAVLQEVLALPLRFRDGDRYAALDARLKLALATGDECMGKAAALVVRVADVDAALQRLLDAGARLRRHAEQGPHERRAAVSLAGLDIVLSQPASRPQVTGA
ncbi:VOC family protein [Solimonas terrae]|uniref:VOC family protein n=1 Tax=Solimonas terrae TaxID=1396819 RepID=UPI001583D363|nr:VOC family protein [Solimonas terrae]